MENSLNQKETVLYSFPKNAREEVRISETIYLNKKYLDFRIFAKKADGNFIPTPKGITISKDLAYQFKEAFKTL